MKRRGPEHEQRCPVDRLSQYCKVFQDPDDVVEIVERMREQSKTIGDKSPASENDKGDDEERSRECKDCTGNDNDTGSESDDSQATVNLDPNMAKPKIRYCSLRFRSDGSHQRDIFIAIQFLVEKFQQIKVWCDSNVEYIPDLLVIGNEYDLFTHELRMREQSLASVTRKMLSKLYNKILEDYYYVTRILRRNQDVKWERTCLWKLAIKLGRLVDQLEYMKTKRMAQGTTCTKWSLSQIESSDALVNEELTTIPHTPGQEVPPIIGHNATSIEPPDATVPESEVPQLALLTQENLSRLPNLTEDDKMELLKRSYTKWIQGLAQEKRSDQYHQSKHLVPSRSTSITDNVPTARHSGIEELVDPVKSALSAKEAKSPAEVEDSQNTLGHQPNYDTDADTDASGSDNSQSDCDALDQFTSDANDVEATNTVGEVKSVNTPVEAVEVISIPAEQIADTSTIRRLIKQMEDLAKAACRIEDEVKTANQKLDKVIERTKEDDSPYELMADLSDTDDGSDSKSEKDFNGVTVCPTNTQSTLVYTNADRDIPIEETLHSQSIPHTQELAVFSASITNAKKKFRRTSREVEAMHKNVNKYC
ncbi:hypothetical protein BGZ46_010576 [Entomortierella lignicola]|nr:hypothetical protein BGZ46_010576 [Entomortierella lignicola]